MRKKALKKKLAKTEKKLEKFKSELRHTKDRLNSMIASSEGPEITAEPNPNPAVTVGEKLEKFFARDRD